MHQGVGGCLLTKSTSMGGRRTRTDPTVWCLSSEDLGTTYALVVAHVKVFIITGIAGKSVGVRVHKNVDNMNALHQTSSVNSGINFDTHRDLDRSLTPSEIKNLLCVWCVTQWQVTQTGQQHAAALCEL